MGAQELVEYPDGDRIQWEEAEALRQELQLEVVPLAGPLRDKADEHPCW